MSSMSAHHEVAAAGPVDIDRAVDSAQIVHVLRSFGILQDDIARATGVSPRAVRMWAARTTPGVPNRTHERRLHDLRQIVLVLREVLAPRGVGQWLRAPNRLLGRRSPLDACAAGDWDAVLGAATAFRDGDYI
jgi:hypothetical protein